MTMTPGTILRIRCPAHPWHGKRVEVVRDDPAFELGNPPESSMIARTIFCRKDGSEPIGFGPAHFFGDL